MKIRIYTAAFEGQSGEVDKGGLQNFVITKSVIVLLQTSDRTITFHSNFEPMCSTAFLSIRKIVNLAVARHPTLIKTVLFNV